MLAARIERWCASLILLFIMPASARILELCFKQSVPWLSDGVLDTHLACLVHSLNAGVEYTHRTLVRKTSLLHLHMWVWMHSLNAGVKYTHETLVLMKDSFSLHDALIKRWC